MEIETKHKKKNPSNYFKNIKYIPGLDKSTFDIESILSPQFS